MDFPRRIFRRGLALICGLLILPQSFCSEREGLLLLEEGRWRLSDRGLDLQNIVLERFLEESCF